MGMLDDEAVEITDKNKAYSFASGGIGDFMADFNTKKQDTGIDEEAHLLDLPEQTDEEPQENEPLEKLKATAAVAGASASLLTIAIDSSLSTVLGLYAGDEPENYKADPEQREELEQAIKEYVKLKGGDIPPGLALVIIILSIYGSKGAMAFTFKKMKKQMDEKENRIKELEAQLAKFNPEENK